MEAVTKLMKVRFLRIMLLGLLFALTCGCSEDSNPVGEDPPPPPPPLTWNMVANPSQDAEDVFKLWGASETEIYAVGRNGTILKFKDSVLTSISLEGMNVDIQSIWGLISNSSYNRIDHYGNQLNSIGWK